METQKNLDAAQGDYPNWAEWHRLAHRAAEHGMTLRVLTTPTRTDHVVHDPRDNSDHYVTAVSCGCRQFVQSGGAGCQHWALLVVNHDWIPEAVAAVEMEMVR